MKNKLFRLKIRILLNYFVNSKLLNKIYDPKIVHTLKLLKRVVKY